MQGKTWLPPPPPWPIILGMPPTLGLNHIHNMFLIEDTQLRKVLTNYLKGKSKLLAPELFPFSIPFEKCSKQDEFQDSSQEHYVSFID
jgi:hypothetical protein